MTLRIGIFIGIVIGLALGVMLCRGKQRSTPDTDYWEKRIDSLNSFYDEETASERLRK